MFATFADDAWIDIQNPSGTECNNKDGATCAGSGVSFINTAGTTLDITFWPKIKTNDVDNKCLKYKTDNSGKLEDEDCDQEMPVGCFINCNDGRASIKTNQN